MSAIQPLERPTIRTTSPGSFNKTYSAGGDQRSVWETAFSPAASQAYPAGTVLFEQGAPVTDIYLLERGLVKFIHLDADGQEVIVSLDSRPGSLLGAYCAVLDHAFITAELVTGCRLRRMPAETFCELLKSNPEMSWQQHLAQSQILYQHISKVAQLGCHSVQHRLELLLLQLIDSMELSPRSEGIRLSLPLKYWEIAQLIAVTPEHLCRVIKAMERDGILYRKKGWIIIPEPERLRRT